MNKVDIATRDGICPACVFHPQDHGPWPGVIMYMDGPGMRPAVQELAERLAGNGYYVLLPDYFYRSGPYAPVDPKVVFTNAELLERHRERFMTPATPERLMSDTEAFLAFLDARADVADGGYGVVGYCMGGRLALLAAGTFPERIAAAASYHGGGLANDAPSAPHVLAPRMKARVYVAGAIEDPHFDEEQKQRLETALANAGVDHVVETYPAKHGWVPRDMAVHDPQEAEHHWRTLVPFFDATLKAPAEA